MIRDTPPADLTPEEWAATPPRVQAVVRQLLAQVAAFDTRIADLEARLNQHSGNSSKPPSSDPPSAPPPPVKTPRGKPKAKGAQPGHPDQQRPLLPEDQVQQVVCVHPTCCPTCHDMLPATLRPVCLPARQQVWEIPDGPPQVTEYQLGLTQLRLSTVQCGHERTQSDGSRLHQLSCGRATRGFMHRGGAGAAGRAASCRA